MTATPEGVEFDRLLMRLRIIKDWILRGAGEISADTQLAAAADVDLAHNLIEHLHARANAAEARVKTLTDALQDAQKSVDGLYELYLSAQTLLIDWTLVGRKADEYKATLAAGGNEG